MIADIEINETDEITIISEKGYKTTIQFQDSEIVLNNLQLNELIKVLADALFEQTK